MKFKHLVLAGTFDHLHLGHQKFIKNSLNKAWQVSCGITTDWINKNKLCSPAIQSFKKRVASVNKFLKHNRLRKKTNIFSLNNPWGMATSDSSLEAIAATQESLKGARLVNQKRKTRGLKPLKILMVDLIAADDKQRISSTRIRLGEINRRGLVYKALIANNKTLFLPQKERPHFKKPLGQLLTGPSSNLSWASLKVVKKMKTDRFPFIVTVGDIATQSFLVNKIPVNLAVIDYRCQRQPIKFNIHYQLTKKASFIHSAVNNPGTLSWSAINVFKNILPQNFIKHQSGIIQIKGEEDLLVLPIILLAPLKTLIFYGQPGQGLVQVKVTEVTKTKALNLVNKFKPYYC